MYTDLTPYAAAKVTNFLLKTAGLDKEIKPQMLYTYFKKNVINGYTDDNGKQYFEGEAFKKWVDSYIKKVENGEAATRVDYAELASQYI